MMDFAEVERAFVDLRKRSPVVVQITNFVSADFQADCTLFIGAHPIMPVSVEEIGEIVSKSDSLLVNIGNLTEERMFAIREALKVANMYGLPVVLDPVGCNASSFRNAFVTEILRLYRVDVLKGNASEVSSIAGKQRTFGGVDGVEDVSDTEIIPLLEKISVEYGCVVVSTGAIDFVVSVDNMVSVTGGSPFLKSVSGMGCCLGSIMAALLTVRDSFAASIIGLEAVKMTSVRAAVGLDVPGSFKARFLDQLYILGR